MVRVTSAEVKQILPTLLENLDPQIEFAHSLLEATRKGRGTEEQLKEIERWLAAHFVAVSVEPDGRVASHSEGGLSVSLMGMSGGAGLEATHYGQSAIALAAQIGIDLRGARPAFFRVT